MLTVKCNNCDTQFTGAPELAGEQMECPYCGAHLRVPFDAPDLDAIKQRAGREQATPPIAVAAPTAQVFDESADDGKNDLAIQANSNHLNAPQEHPQRTPGEFLGSLHTELLSLRKGTRALSRLLLTVVALTAAILVCLIILTIGVWAR